MYDDPNDQVDPSNADDTHVQDETQTPANNSLDEMDPDDAKHEEAESPAVKDEENAFSGDASVESPDIDDEMEKTTGRILDPEQPTPLGED